MKFSLLNQCLIRSRIDRPNQDKKNTQLVTAIQRGNRLQTATLYADLAMSLMCQSYIKEEVNAKYSA
jgi:hypothetical protein